VSAQSLGRFVIGVGVMAVALATSGCLSDDTVASIPGYDAGAPETSVSVLDASGSVDGQGNPPPDAGPDAAKPDGGGVSVLGLVVGGQTARSPSFSFQGTASAAHAPVSRSTNYQLVGGMVVSTQKK
jgi:hypothetical protein